MPKSETEVSENYPYSYIAQCILIFFTPNKKHSIIKQIIQNK